MSNSLQPTLSLCSSFNEDQWVIEIRTALDDDNEFEEYTKTPVSIFSVPKTLLSTDPDSYIPQQVSLGPYHCLRPELYEMRRYKFAAAKTTQKQLQSPNFQHIVDRLRDLEPRIRASYHKFLEFKGETLVWMMAVDASFLLEFLQNYAASKEGQVPTSVASRMLQLFAILRDLVMLENQIPLFLLRKMIEFQFESSESADRALRLMLGELCKELYPFEKMDHEVSNVQVTKCAHLLDFLYHMIVPKSESSVEITDEEQIDEEVKQEGEEITHEEQIDKGVKQEGEEITHEEQIDKEVKQEGEETCINENSGNTKQLLQLIWNLLSRSFTWKFIPNLPEFKVPSKRVEDFSLGNESCSSNSNIDHKAPLVEEIKIPSVSDLSKAGVRFRPSNGGISSIDFDIKKVTLYLPTVILNVNTEVIFRNLVAYEGCNASGPMFITRYTELMNGIIDTEEDAKLLGKWKIILNSLKSDKEVINLWNGMSKSVKLTKVPHLDRVIKDVNKYYNGRWKVKVGKFMKVYVFGSWQFLTFLAAILLFLLMTFQSLCSVYNCARIFHFGVGTIITDFVWCVSIISDRVTDFLHTSGVLSD